MLDSFKKKINKKSFIYFINNKLPKIKAVVPLSFFIFGFVFGLERTVEANSELPFWTASNWKLIMKLLIYMDRKFELPKINAVFPLASWILGSVLGLWIIMVATIGLFVWTALKNILFKIYKYSFFTIFNHPKSMQ